MLKSLQEHIDHDTTLRGQVRSPRGNWPEQRQINNCLWLFLCVTYGSLPSVTRANELSKNATQLCRDLKYSWSSLKKLIPFLIRKCTILGCDEYEHLRKKMDARKRIAAVRIRILQVAPLAT